MILGCPGVGICIDVNKESRDYWSSLTLSITSLRTNLDWRAVMDWSAAELSSSLAVLGRCTPYNSSYSAPRIHYFLHATAYLQESYFG